jgi:hypothetical protein
VGFLAPKVKSPPPLPPAPTRADPSVAEAEAQQRRLAARRRGRASTVVAGEMSEPAQTRRVELTGQ